MSRPQIERSALLSMIVQTLERDLSAVTLLFHATVAEQLGVNMTDYKALEVIYRHNEVSASDLGEQMRVTPGAVTGIVDRLERGGFVQRIKGATDRRQVRIMPVQERQEQVQRLFLSMGQAMMMLTERYTDQELAIIHSYLVESIHVVEAETDKMRKQSL